MHKHLLGGWAEDEARLQRCPNLNTGGSLWTSGTSVFQWEGDWTLAQVEQRICKVSLFGDVKNLSRCGPGQTRWPSWRCWRRGLDQVTFRCPFQLQPVILFTQSRKMKNELKKKYSRHNKPHTKIFLHLKIFNYSHLYGTMHFRENKYTRSQMQYIFLYIIIPWTHPICK